MKDPTKKLVSLILEAVPIYLFSLMCSSFIVNVSFLSLEANEPFRNIVVDVLYGLVYSIFGGIFILSWSVTKIASWLIFLFTIICISQFDHLQNKLKKMSLFILTGILILIEVAYGLFVTKSQFILF
jgi:hypothetical protein